MRKAVFYVMQENINQVEGLKVAVSVIRENFPLALVHLQGKFVFPANQESITVNLVFLNALSARMESIIQDWAFPTKICVIFAQQESTPTLLDYPL